jgi:hypothetical protein
MQNYVPKNGKDWMNGYVEGVIHGRRPGYFLRYWIYRLSGRRLLKNDKK